MTKEEDRTKEIPGTEEPGPPDAPDAPDALDERRRLAAVQGVVVKEDANLKELLAALDPLQDMPEAPYGAVLKILERVRACEKELSGAAHPAPDQPDSDPNP